MFDTHVNLHSPAFNEDLDAVLARAKSAGVAELLAICDRLDSLPQIRAIVRGRANAIWHSVGVHPHHAKDYTDLTAATLIALSTAHKAVAIGETGLDFHYGYSPEADQTRVFVAHIEASQALSRPIILHLREADVLAGDMLEAAYAQKPFPMLMHCYTSGARLRDRALAMGAYFSVSGILSFKSAREVRAVMAEVPLDRILLETDCPYLTPIPHRGTRNEPAFLRHVGEALAALKGVDVETVIKQTRQNAHSFFGTKPLDDGPI